MSLGGLQGAASELDEDARLPGRDRGREGAAPPVPSAAEEGRGGSGARGPGEHRPRSVVDAAKRRVPGHWEGDLIIGKNGTSCAATRVERMSGFTGLLALPSKHAEPAADAVIDYFNELPEMMYASLAWNQGTAIPDHRRGGQQPAPPPTGLAHPYRSLHPATCRRTPCCFHASTPPHADPSRRGAPDPVGAHLRHRSAKASAPRPHRPLPTLDHPRLTQDRSITLTASATRFPAVADSSGG